MFSALHKPLGTLRDPILVFRLHGLLQQQARRLAHFHTQPRIVPLRHQEDEVELKVSCRCAWSCCSCLYTSEVAKGSTELESRPQRLQNVRVRGPAGVREPAGVDEVDDGSNAIFTGCPLGSVLLGIRPRSRHGLGLRDLASHSFSLCSERQLHPLFSSRPMSDLMFFTLVFNR